jgi:hypothetical protein
MEIFGLILIFSLRLLIPLTIFKWPLYGGIASLIVDALDTNIVKPFGVEIPNYTITDKYLDLYYLTFELIVSLKWFNVLAVKTSTILFALRIIGVSGFQMTGNEFWLFIGPNLFENFFLFYLVLLGLKIETKKKIWVNSYVKLFACLIFLWILKLPQEIILHVWRVGSPVETFFSLFGKLFN